MAGAATAIHMFLWRRQPDIADIYIRQCTNSKVCYESRKRTTYATPLEIIYMTPLTTWNPYDIQLYSDKDQNIVRENGKRNGGRNLHNAYNGTLLNQYYRTPTELFSGGEIGTSPADTAKTGVGVLDKNNTLRSMSASGVRVFLPYIPGVGVLRTRYPIAPVHAEGSSVWKEINALKDVVMRLVTNEKYLLEKLPKAPEEKSTAPKTPTQTTTRSSTTKPSATTKPTSTTPQMFPIQQQLTLVTSLATGDPRGEHYHTLDLTKDQQERLQKGEVLDFLTSHQNAHTHLVKVKFYNGRYQVVKCNSRDIPC